MVYEAAEDSFLLSSCVKAHISTMSKKARESCKVLDLGCGNCIQAESCVEAGIPRENIMAADIEEKAVELARQKGFCAVCSDLFSSLEGTFDIIIFNPPYLPAHKNDKAPDTTGGKRGDETTAAFLEQARQHLKENGVVLLLLSSLTPHKKIEKLIKKYYEAEQIGEKKLFFEKLFVLRLRKK